MNCVIATNRNWNTPLKDRLEKRTGINFEIITSRNDLTVEKLIDIKPRYIFLPHWSYIVPEDVYKNYECVIFHMTDVPFGRGGSPLQNLISRGIYETRISALRCVNDLDAGPVYLKKPLSLYGAAEEIYLRASELVEEMIYQIIEEKPRPVEQTGEITCFARRKPREGNIADLTSLKQVYDYVRMLDADGYPHAFLETKHLRFEFGRASLKDKHVIADVRITERENE